MPVQNSASSGRTRKAPRRTRGKPTDVDAHVGRRIRQRRILLGMSQEKLGDALNITFQQVQKYERGSNRVGAGRLFELSRALDVPVSYFFDDLVQTPRTGESKPVEVANIPADLLGSRESLSLMTAFFDIGDRNVRRRVLDLVKVLANSNASEPEAPAVAAE